MPPKAGGKAKKSKKSAKPAWMADDVWAVSQDLPTLLNSFAGTKSDKPAKSDKSVKSDKAAPPGKGSKAEPLPNIPKAQVLLARFAPSTVKSLQHEQGIATCEHHNATDAAHSIDASLAHSYGRS